MKRSGALSLGARVRRAGVALLAAAAAAGTLVAAPLARPALAEVSPWTTPVQISETVPGSKDWFPDVAVDDAGNVTVVWNWAKLVDTPDDLGRLYVVRADGQGWTRQNDIGVIWNGDALRSSITVDRNGRLYLVYKGYGTLDKVSRGPRPEDLWFMTADGAQADTINGWSAPRRITRGTVGYFSDIAVDSRGTLHIIWTESDAAGKYGLYYTSSADGGATWSERVALEDERLVWWYRAQLKVDARDNLNVVWEVMSPQLGADSLGFGTTAGAVFARSTDGGATWTRTPIELDGTGSQPAAGRAPAPAAGAFSTLLQPERPQPGAQQPAIAVDGRGTLVLVYRDPNANRLLYRLSADGQVWSPAEPIPGLKAGVPRPFDVYDMATDGAGNVYLAAVAYVGDAPAPSLVAVEWNGRGWGWPAVIMTGPPYPEYPKLAVGQGNQLHLVWFNGDRLADRTPQGIWYSTATTGAPPRLAPASGPAPAAALPPRSAVPAAPTPTPVPVRPRVDLRDRLVAEPAAEGADAVPAPLALRAWLRDLPRQPVFPILVALLPALLVLGGLFLFARPRVSLPAAAKLPRES